MPFKKYYILILVLLGCSSKGNYKDEFYNRSWQNGKKVIPIIKPIGFYKWNEEWVLDLYKVENLKGNRLFNKSDYGIGLTEIDSFSVDKEFNRIYIITKEKSRRNSIIMVHKNGKSTKLEMPVINYFKIDISNGIIEAYLKRDSLFQQIEKSNLIYKAEDFWNTFDGNHVLPWHDNNEVNTPLSIPKDVSIYGRRSPF